MHVNFGLAAGRTEVCIDLRELVYESHAAGRCQVMNMECLGIRVICRIACWLIREYLT